LAYWLCCFLAFLQRVIRTNTFRHFAKRVQSLNEVNNVNKENPQNTYR
jgi:hypothetical protein